MELQLFNLCQMFNCTPSQIMNEDADLIYSMINYHGAYRAVDALKRATGKAIHNLPQSVFTVIESLEEQGIKARGLE